MPFDSIVCTRADAERCLQVGSVVYCHAQRLGKGLVYAVNSGAGEHSVLLYGVVFYLGMRMIDVPESDLRGFEFTLIDQVESLAEVTRVLRKVEETEALRAEMLRMEEQARETELTRLRNAPYYAHLEQGDDHSSGKLASINIKRELERLHPGVVFCVQALVAGLVYVQWRDGPTTAEVERTTLRFKAGYADARGGEVPVSRTPWTLTFGGAEIISASRSLGDES